MKKLNEKQLRFCQEYLIDLNGTQAAIRAGYSKRSARSIAQENLTKPDIKNEIEKRLGSNSNELNSLRTDVLLRLKDIAFSNLSDVVTWDHGGIKVLPNANLRNLKSLEIEKGSVKVSLHDVLKALELLGRHLGLFAPSRDKCNTNSEDVKKRLFELVDRVKSVSQRKYT